MDKTGVKVEDYELENEQNCTLVITSNILLQTQLLQSAVGALTEGGFILTREKPDTKSTFSNGFRLKSVFEKSLKDEKFLLLRKVMNCTTQNIS
jgi:hypothetical protein